MGKPDGCRLFGFIIVTFCAVVVLAIADDQTLRAFAWVFLGIGGLALIVEAWKLSRECMKSDEPGTTGTSDNPRVDPWGLQPRFNIENI